MANLENIVGIEETKIEKKNINVSETFLSQLYNREVKERFLRDVPEHNGTVEVYSVYLIKAAEWERRIGKDLYEFSREDALDMFSNIFSSSQPTPRVFHSICKKYCAWATGEGGLNKTGVNPIELIDFRKHVLPMLNVKGITQFLTEEQVWEFENIARNYQDFVCLVGAFYSIKGDRCSELVNLKREDMDSLNNTLRLTEKDGSIRILKVSQRLFDIFLKAYGEDVYNRQGEEGKGGRTTANLKEGSEYVIRPTTVNGEDFVTAQTIATRTKKLLEEAGYMEMSINDIYIAGKLSVLRKIELEKGYVDVEDYKEVNIRFGDSPKNYANIKALYERTKTKID